MAKSAKRNKSRTQNANSSYRATTSPTERALPPLNEYDLGAAVFSRVGIAVSKAPTTNGTPSRKNNDPTINDGLMKAARRAEKLKTTKPNLRNTGPLMPGRLRAAGTDTLPKLDGPSKLERQSRTIDASTTDETKKRPTCKKRPDSKEARKGSGGSRAFIPWCKHS